MQPFLAVLAIVLTSFITGTAAQSSSPNCIACPTEDQAGFPLGASDTTADPIFCSYPSVAGQDPMVFYCTYNKVCVLLSRRHTASLTLLARLMGHCVKIAMRTCVRRPPR